MFNADVIVLKTKWSEKLAEEVLTVASHVLGSAHGIIIEKAVPPEEYDKNTSSKEVNKYIRVKKQVVEQREKNREEEFQLIKTGKGKYRSEIFASAKYAFMSVSQMNEFTVIWFSFHSRLHKALRGFDKFTELVVREFSVRNRTESMVLSATSSSRNSDHFSLFIGGRERSSLSGKGALTDVKNTYGIDINKVMDNIDQNLAIYYGPLDFAEVKKDMADQKRRIDAFRAQAEKIKVENQEDGTNMMKAFEEENRQLESDLQRRYELVKKAMSSDPIGTVVFFKMTEKSAIKGAALPVNETSFGRNV